MNLIEHNKAYAVQGMNDFLRNFAYVPDDKLNWKPFPTAKSALQVAAHTALYAGRFAEMIENRALPSPQNLEEWIAKNIAEENAIVSRQEMIEEFQAGTNRAVAAMDALSSEDLELKLSSGQGWSLPMAQVIKFPGWHAILHNGQIDYLQTCWGDEKIYVE